MLAQVQSHAATHALAVAGIVQASDTALPDGVVSLLLLAPDGPRFWAHFTASDAYLDGAPDPMDRWSKSVIDAMAQKFGAQPFYPFDARPHHPFYTWALASGRAFKSPVQWLVHDQAGLWLSFRGALGFGQRIEMASAPPPCTECARPCATACPIGALTDKGYDLDACHAFLDRPDGALCLTQGCRVRAACPVSQSHGRVPAQSEFHMRQFHP